MINLPFKIIDLILNFSVFGNLILENLVQVDYTIVVLNCPFLHLQKAILTGDDRVLAILLVYFDGFAKFNCLALAIVFALDQREVAFVDMVLLVLA
jgi:hypothetical protein